MSREEARDALIQIHQLLDSKRRDLSNYSREHNSFIAAVHLDHWHKNNDSHTILWKRYEHLVQDWSKEEREYLAREVYNYMTYGT